MFRRLGQKIYRFMLGRNGADNLFRFCIILSLIISLISVFSRNFWVLLALQTVEYSLFGYAIFRLLSRNVFARRRENAKYLAIKSKVLSFFSRKKNQFKQRKTHVYKDCPHCKAHLRLPRVKGKHTVSCPKCRKTFETKI